MIGGSFRLCTLRHIVSRGRVRLWPRCLLFERKAVVEICRWKEDPVTFTHLEATFIHFLYFLTFFFFLQNGAPDWVHDLSSLLSPPYILSPLLSFLFYSLISSFVRFFSFFFFPVFFSSHGSSLTFSLSSSPFLSASLTLSFSVFLSFPFVQETRI